MNPLSFAKIEECNKEERAKLGSRWHTVDAEFSANTTREFVLEAVKHQL